jgi:hypothetical protein
VKTTLLENQSKDLKINRKMKLVLILVVLMAFTYSAHSAVLPPNAGAIEREVEGLIGELNAEDLQRTKRFLGDLFEIFEIHHLRQGVIKTAGSVVGTAVHAVGHVGGSVVGATKNIVDPFGR